MKWSNPSPQFPEVDIGATVTSYGIVTAWLVDSSECVDKGITGKSNKEFPKPAKSKSRAIKATGKGVFQPTKSRFPYEWNGEWENEISITWEALK